MEGFETGSFGMKVFDPRTSHAVDIRQDPPRQLQVSVPTVYRFWSDLPDMQRLPQSVIDVKVTTETFLETPSHQHRPSRDAHRPPSPSSSSF